MTQNRVLFRYLVQVLIAPSRRKLRRPFQAHPGCGWSSVFDVRAADTIEGGSDIPRLLLAQLPCSDLGWFFGGRFERFIGREGLRGF